MANRQIVIAVGLGCRLGCTSADLVAAVQQLLALQHVALDAVGGLFSADFKADSAALEHAAQLLGKPLQLLSTASLAAQSALALTRSAAVSERFGLPSVAETAALAGAFELGARRAPARLLSARQIRGAAACALACAEREP